MKPEEPQVIQTIYDIIFGQRFFLLPMNSVEIKPTKFLGEAKALQAQYQPQKRCSGKNR